MPVLGLKRVSQLNLNIRLNSIQYKLMSAGRGQASKEISTMILVAFYDIHISNH